VCLHWQHDLGECIFLCTTVSMDYASLTEIWPAPKNEEPPKSRGRRNGGSKHEDDFSKRHNADMRAVRPAPQAPDYGSYHTAPEYSPYRISAPIHPAYAYNRFHGDHMGTPPMQIYCPHCHNHRRGGDDEMQRMTMYLSFGIFFLLLFDIGTRLSSRLK
jgi:hypothetical protein